MSPKPFHNVQKLLIELNRFSLKVLNLVLKCHNKFICNKKLLAWLDELEKIQKLLGWCVCDYKRNFYRISGAYNFFYKTECVKEKQTNCAEYLTIVELINYLRQAVSKKICWGEITNCNV